MKRQKKCLSVAIVVFVAFVLGIAVVQARWVRLGNDNYVANLLEVCRTGFLISVGYTDFNNPRGLPDDPHVQIFAVASPQGRIGDFVDNPNSLVHIADGSLTVRLNRLPIRGLPTVFVNANQIVTPDLPSFTYVYGAIFVKWSPNFRPTANQQIGILGRFPETPDLAILLDTGKVHKCFPFDYSAHRNTSYEHHFDHSDHHEDGQRE